MMSVREAAVMTSLNMIMWDKLESVKMWSQVTSTLSEGLGTIGFEVFMSRQPW